MSLITACRWVLKALPGAAGLRRTLLQEASIGLSGINIETKCSILDLHTAISKRK